MSDKQKVLLFVSHLPTHHMIWHMSQIVGAETEYEDKVINRDLGFRDRNEQAWLMSCFFFTTKKRAIEYVDRTQDDSESWNQDVSIVWLIH